MRTVFCDDTVSLHISLMQLHCMVVYSGMTQSRYPFVGVYPYPIPLFCCIVIMICSLSLNCLSRIVWGGLVCVAKFLLLWPCCRYSAKSGRRLVDIGSAHTGPAAPRRQQRPASLRSPFKLVVSPDAHDGLQASSCPCLRLLLPR